MQRSTMERCLGMLASAEVSTRVVVTQATVDAWMFACDHIDDAAALAATKAWLQRDYAYFPKPGQWLALVAETACNLPTPEVAWSEVLGAIHTVGYYETPEWSCEPIATAVARMGWPQLCNTPSDTIGVTASQFRGIYAGLRAMATQRVTQPGIAGPAEPPSLLGLLKTCHQCHKILPLKSASDLCALCVPPLALPAPEDAPLPNGVAQALGLRWRKV